MKTLVYQPKLTKLTGSINAALLMSQLEFWFKNQSGKPFYKFLEPCHHAAYREGDSWQEELAVSTTEFRSAFKRIGVAYKSKKAFLESPDRFRGKYYASYYDRIRKMTFYYRNDTAVEAVFKAIYPMKTADTKKQNQRQAKSSQQQELSGKQSKSIRKDQMSALPEIESIGSPNEKKQDGLYIENKQIRHHLRRHREEQNESIHYTKVCELYNTYLGAYLGYCKNLENEEKQNLNKLWPKLEGRTEQFELAFKKVSQSTLLCSKNPTEKRWRASLSWLLEKEHLLEVLEGIYDDRKMEVTLCNGSNISAKSFNCGNRSQSGF